MAKQPVKKKVAKKTGRPVGRPRKPIDWELVANLRKIHCTAEEIAAVAKVDLKTLHNRCKRDTGMSFSTFLSEKKGEGRASLRRLQWQAANAGDKTMLVWLGKNLLGQTDRSKLDVDLRVEKWSDDKLEDEARRILLRRDGNGPSDDES